MHGEDSMSGRMGDLKVGEIVYQYGAPQKCGVLIDIKYKSYPDSQMVLDTPENRKKYAGAIFPAPPWVPQTGGSGRAERYIRVYTGKTNTTIDHFVVQRMNGTTFTTGVVCRLEKLVEQHVRKAEKQSNTLKNLQAYAAGLAGLGTI
jgi:hypothetical protein